jgi:hypothetical protein
LAGGFPGHAGSRELPEFLVNQGKKFVHRLIFTSANGLQNQRHFTHGRWSVSRVRWVVDVWAPRYFPRWWRYSSGCPRVAQTFQSAGSRDFPVPCRETGNWKVARTRRQECLRYGVGTSGSDVSAAFQRRNGLFQLNSLLNAGKGHRSARCPCLEEMYSLR